MMCLVDVLTILELGVDGKKHGGLGRETEEERPQICRD